MRARLLSALGRTARAIDVEGGFIGAGTLGLTFLAWQLDPLLGVVVASVAFLGLGIVLAPPET